jgi:quercetin dioxygenase-like cupin family protein
MRPMLLAGALAVAPAISAYAQDAVAVDAKHYRVELENEQVRVLRIKYRPGEKSVMHQHPASVAVFLTDGQVKFTTADGKSEEATVKAGSTMWGNTDTHLPENVGAKPFELILVELKGKTMPAK